MNFEVDSAAAVLKRTPETLRAMLSELPAGWIETNEGEKTWSPFDVLGHLIHGEKTDWIPRARLILETGESKPFVPFDRFAQQHESAGKNLADLLAEFQTLRNENLRTLEQMKLTNGDLAKTGIHPDLGRVTLGELLATWVAHDLDHIVQIARTMAKQYESAVGPWKQFLSVLR